MTIILGRFIIAALVSGCFFVTMASAATPVVPICEGLTIVTAIHQPQGDYESIKRIESFSPDGYRLRYSGYRPDPNYDPDLNDGPAPPWQPVSVYRTVLSADLENSSSYLQQFETESVPEAVRGTTALGISHQTFLDLKAGKSVDFAVYQTILSGMPLEADDSANGGYRLPGKMQLVDPKPTPINVIINNHPATLPAIHVKGEFLWEQADFYFLDDETNPISLKFEMGSDTKLHEDQLLVIKINYSCGSPQLKDQPPNGIEKALVDTGKADIYSIYFDFNSNSIRPESEASLKEIAEVLRRHADWKLQINGHTDNIGVDQYNLDLSKRRAAAVKDALVKLYGIDAGRLSTSGYGKAQPKDTNDTLEGRAHNRRVELIRQN